MEISLRELYQLEDRENSSDISGDNSPPSTTFAASISSPKRRRSIQKKVVTVPIKNVEGSRFKGECTPPSDSWAWRKYGQKPIKGSPYPRGYYRCSSSKGCPARKQVEKSRSDPNMLIVTYSYEHNHPWPTPRNHHHNRHSTTTTTPTTTAATDTTPLCPSSSNPKIELINNNKQNNQPIIQTQSMDPSGDHTESVLVAPTDELWWFPQNQYCNYNNNHNHNQISSDRHSLLTSYNMSGGDLEIDNIFSMDQEVEDSLFADLGELPECSVVFRQPAAGGEEQLAWCGTTG